jgi:hypothetical protein
MSSSSRPLSAFSGDQLSFQINEWEWVRTDTSSHNTWRFALNSRRPEGNCPMLIENSAVLPARRRSKLSVISCD